MSSPIVAIYARVSSEQQSTARTIDSQLAALRERVAADGLHLTEEGTFIDDGFSGAILVRPALERLRDLAAVGGIDRLYVQAPDRLARKYARSGSSSLMSSSAQVSNWSFSTTASDKRLRMSCSCRYKAWWPSMSVPRFSNVDAEANVMRPWRGR